MHNPEKILALLASHDEDGTREGAHLAGDARLEEAIPVLIELLQSDKPGVVEAVERALSKIGGAKTVQGLAPLLRSDNVTLRNASMDLLRLLGNQAINILFGLLYDDDADIRIFVSDILGKSGNINAVPPLTAALLKDPEVNVRYQAAVSLGELGFPQAVDSLIQALGDEEWVQFAVIEALIKIRAESCLGPLMKILEKSTPLVAAMIVEALGEIGNIKAVPVLMNGLSKAHPFLRNKIAKAIVKLLGPGSLALMSQKDRALLKEALLAALADTGDDDSTQKEALVGLGALGGAQSSAAIIEYVRKLDPDKDHDRIQAGINALSAIGFNEALENVITGGYGYDEAKSIVVQAMCPMHNRKGITLLKETFWNCSRDVQRMYMECLAEQCTVEDMDFFLKVLTEHDDGTILKHALRYLGGNADYESAGEAMLKLTEHPYDDVKEVAIETCIRINSPKMVERFREMARNANIMRRMMGVYALGRQDVDGNIDILNEALEDAEPEVRRLGVEALSQQCTLTHKYMSHIVPRLFDESRDVRLAVLDALGRCPDDSVLSLLLQALHDQDVWVKARVVEALGQQKREEAVPRLVELLNDDNQLVILKSIEALSEIGGQEAFSAILGLVASDDPEIQQMAEVAVDRMRGRERG